MGLADIKDRLAHIAGIEKLTVEQVHDREVFRLGAQTVEIPAGNAGVRNRVQFLADHLKSIEAIVKVDQAVAAIQTPQPKPETKPMSTIGEQLKAARAQLADARQGAANAVAESASASGAVLVEVNKVLKEAGELRAEVAELTNGGPA